MRFRLQVRNEWLIYLFILANILDVGGGFKIKYLSAMLLIFYILYQHKKIRVDKREMVLFIVVPMISFAYSVVVSGVSLAMAFSAITYNLTVVLAICFCSMNINMDKILKMFMKLMYLFAAIILFLFLCFFLVWMIGKANIAMQISSFFKAKRMGMFGYNNFSGRLLPVVYFGGSMFLIFGIALACYYKNVKYICIIYLANIAVLTSANILFSTFILFCYFIIGDFKKSIKICITFLGITVTVIFCILFYDKIINNFKEIIDDVTMKSVGSQIKVGHIQSAFRYMFQNARFFLFGMGGNAAFFTTGTNRMQTGIEVSQVEFWREFGSIYACLFFSYILMVGIKLYHFNRNTRILGIGFLVLFIATGTNPQLMSPLFLIILFLCRYWMRYKSKEEMITRKERIVLG